MNREESKQLFRHRVKLLSMITIFLLLFIGGWLALYVFEITSGSGNYGSLVRTESCSKVLFTQYPIRIAIL